MALIWSKYTTALASRPILTKVFTAGKRYCSDFMKETEKKPTYFTITGSLMFIGDFIAQKLDKKPFDIKRDAILTTYASAMTPGRNLKLIFTISQFEFYDCYNGLNTYYYYYYDLQWFITGTTLWRKVFLVDL